MGHAMTFWPHRFFETLLNKIVFKQILFLFPSNMYKVLKAKYSKELLNIRLPLRYGANIDDPILYGTPPRKKQKLLKDLYQKEELEERYEIFKDIDNRPCLSNYDTRKSTISMTLEKALFHQGGKIKRNKLDRVVSGISKASFWVYLFLNWYTQETSDLYPIADQCQTSITFLLYYFVHCETRGRKLHGSKTHLLLNRFATMYPNSRQIDLSDIKIDSNLFNNTATSIMNACKLYQKLLNEDDEFYIKKLQKAIVSGQFMRWERAHITPTKNMTYELYAKSRNISRALFTLEFRYNINKNVNQENHNTHFKFKWLRKQVFKRDPRCADIYMYPTSQFKVDRLTIDLKTMQSLFGNKTEWKDHFDTTKMGINPLLLTTMKTIKTDGFTVQFVFEKQRQVQYMTKQRPSFPFYEWNTKEPGPYEKLCPQVDYPDDKPRFDNIKSCPYLPKKHGIRFLNTLNKMAIDQIKKEHMVCVDPGIKLVYCAKAGQDIVSMSNGRHHHLLMSKPFRNYDQKRKRGIQTQLDLLSMTRRLDDYLEAVNHVFNDLSNVFGDLEYRKWRFRKDGLRRKIDDLVYMELMTGKKQCANFYFNDKRRAKQTFKVKDHEHRNIYWGDGSYGHGKVNAVVPNKRLIYALCKKARVIITPEFRTSKLCCKCHHILPTKMVDINGQRQRQCTNCLVVVDRDVNASIKIEQVVKSYCRTYEKPEWQELDFEATTPSGYPLCTSIEPPIHDRVSF
eukprot:NODE_87_length_21935_cov_0.397142.p2 type:complete len:735 gc:universal NODE_87_length_21935_cov_0.397142:3587-5791(+)